MIKHRAQDKNERGLSVMEKLKLDFYYGREAEQFTFYRLPKALITDACFKGMTNNAKLLYGLMLDRMSLSKKRGWIDEANKVFIKYSLNNIEEDLNVSRKTASSLLKELEEIGLIDMIQQPGVANIIYVKNFVSEREQDLCDQSNPVVKYKKETKPVEKVHQCKNSTGEKTTPVEKSNQCSFEPWTSGKITLVPGEKLHPSNIEIDNNINNNSINQSYQSIDEIDVMDETEAYMALIRDNIDYDIMMQDHEWRYRDMYEELYQIICDVVCVPRQVIRIEGEDYPYNLVKSRFLKLKKSHLEYVIGCMERNTTKIANIKAYLITALYNAPNTISHYYSTEVNYDMGGVQSGTCMGNL